MPVRVLKLDKKKFEEDNSIEKTFLNVKERRYRNRSNSGIVSVRFIK